jgi:hypothetical protein
MCLKSLIVCLRKIQRGCSSGQPITIEKQSFSHNYRKSRATTFGRKETGSLSEETFAIKSFNSYRKLRYQIINNIKKLSMTIKQ